MPAQPLNHTKCDFDYFMVDFLAEKVPVAEKKIRILLLGNFSRNLLEMLPNNFDVFIADGKSLVKIENKEYIDLYAKFEYIDILELENNFDIAIANNFYEYVHYTYNDYQINILYEWIRRKCDIFLGDIVSSEMNAYWNGFLPSNPLINLSKFSFCSDIFQYVCENNLDKKSVIFASNKYTFFDGVIEKLRYAKAYNEPIETYTKRVYHFKNKILFSFHKRINKNYFKVNEIEKLTWLHNQNIDSKVQIPMVYGVNNALYSTDYLREKIEGREIESGKIFNSNEFTDKNLMLLISLFDRTIDLFAKNNIYLNDIRPWNFILSEKGLTFIDFELTSDFEQDADGLPQIIAWICTRTILLSRGELVWDTRVIINCLLKQMRNMEEIDSQNLFYSPWRNFDLIRGKADLTNCTDIEGAIQEICETIKEISFTE